MTTGNDFDEPIFSAVLTPHRSLGPTGFWLLMSFVALTCFAAGALFFSIGAWPVVGFLGLDVLAIFVAFRLNYRSARATEEVVLGRDALVVRKVAPNGRAREVRFNPRWVRLSTVEDPEEGVLRIHLQGQGSTVPIGAFLNPDDRTSFARAFRAALAQVRA